MLCCVLIYYSNFDLNLYLVLLCTILPSLSLCISLFFTVSLSFSLCVSLSMSFSLFLSLPLSLSLSLSPSLSVSLSLSRFVCVSPSLSPFRSDHTSTNKYLTRWKVSLMKSIPKGCKILELADPGPRWELIFLKSTQLSTHTGQGQSWKW